MLATHGFSEGVFAGHSYGTSWLSYVCKYAPSAVAALLFLDPICFCLHTPRLTRNFVYNTPDPGSISYMVRTDMMINWTIQVSWIRHGSDILVLFNPPIDTSPFWEFAESFPLDMDSIVR